jgi:hypothetical protein
MLNQVIDHKLPDHGQWKKVPISLEGSEEVFYLYHHDMAKCLRALWANPALTKNRKYAPEKHYVNSDKTEQIPHEMETGNWWWETQVLLPASVP